ncbi:hypothetical protein D5018_18295 [Parashewanella curva]|uniref:Uncharacterized protein n=1 Tax=Parashewanella curva TaxID=2338552 RepID=A0A3L8PS85_9GAMM|nr:hypothetical protein [Parashewanella curva]RLV58255.1 hypothetical protein D5018_18295 [Parashewanella curva]
MIKSLFAERAVAIAKELCPDIINKVSCVIKVSGEKKTTVANWVFSRKAPPKAKKLTIADRFGVDTSYLFDGDDFSLPITKYIPEHNCYSVPLIEHTQIKVLFEAKSKPLPVYQRFTTSLLRSDPLDYEPNRTYCLLATTDIQYPPMILDNNIIIFNLSSVIKRLQYYLCMGETTQLLWLDSQGYYVDSKGSNYNIKASDVLMPVVQVVSRY